MTPRTLFIIILKVLGIISVREVIISIPQFLSAIISFFTNISIGAGLGLLLFSVISIGFYLWLSYTLIYKADLLVTRFGLDQNFSEPLLHMNISPSAILRIAVIITGAVLLLNEIPAFCRIVYGIIQETSVRYLANGNPDWSGAIFSGVKIILALVIIGERNRIMEVLTNKAVSVDEPTEQI